MTAATSDAVTSGYAGRVIWVPSSAEGSPRPGTRRRSRSPSPRRGGHSRGSSAAAFGETLHGEIIDQGPIEARVIYEPYGVVAAILPFNWPPIHFTKKCAPALAAGNTVVVKPGEQAPLTVLRLAELASEILPPGVLNAVPGLAAGRRFPRTPGWSGSPSPAPR